MRRLERGSSRIVAGHWYGTPKEVWGFSAELGRGTPARRAKRFLQANADLLGLQRDLDTVLIEPPKVLQSLAATHVIFQQRLHALRVHRAYVTVHIGPDGCAYLLKNRAVPGEFAPEKVPRSRSSRSAVERARVEVGIGKRSVLPAAQVEKLWFPLDGALRLAHKVRLARPERGEEWIVYVDAKNGRVLSRYDNMAARRAKARVFDPNPVIALGGHRAATNARGEPLRNLPEQAYHDVTLRDLDETGFVQGPRVTTARTKRRVNSLNSPLQFARSRGREQSGFREVMAYHHLDGACRYLESLGFTGSKAIFQAPIVVDVTARGDGSFYSPGEHCLIFGTGGVADAEDGEVILHEFGHAIQDAIIPDFGQSVQAAAIGEGFGDYWAASHFARRKKKEYETSVMSWDGVQETDRDPPCVRRVDETFTFEDFEHADELEHQNGQIWSAALWQIRKAIGRRRADCIIVESHFQLDGFTTFARAARAILDANRHLCANRDRARLIRIFTRRGIGPLE